MPADGFRAYPRLASLTVDIDTDAQTAMDGAVVVEDKMPQCRASLEPSMMRFIEPVRGYMPEAVMYGWMKSGRGD